MIIDTRKIKKTVDRAYVIIAVYAYICIPIYCYITYGYMPSTIIEPAKDLWDIKNNLLDIVDLINA